VSEIAVTFSQRLRDLQASDFDEWDPQAQGPENLTAICDTILEEGLVLDCASVMFEVMERLDTVELGSPGPLVHVLESATPAHEPHLEDSIRRKPSPLSVWMVNRILNTKRSDRARWLELLRLAATHPLAAETTRADALAFVEYQSRH
jgi:hypothetical protein